MAGWFADKNVDDIPDNPNELPNNTYRFAVTSAILAKTKEKRDSNGNVLPRKTGITFKYQIVEGAWSNFFPLVDWVRVPDENTKDDEIDRMLSYLKMRLLAFGFSPDEIQEFEPGSEAKCLNRQFYGTTSSKKQENSDNVQIRVQKFDPIDGENVDHLGTADFPDDDIV